MAVRLSQVFGRSAESWLLQQRNTTWPGACQPDQVEEATGGLERLAHDCHGAEQRELGCGKFTVAGQPGVVVAIKLGVIMLLKKNCSLRRFGTLTLEVQRGSAGGCDGVLAYTSRDTAAALDLRDDACATRSAG